MTKQQFLNYALRTLEKFQVKVNLYHSIINIYLKETNELIFYQAGNDHMDICSEEFFFNGIQYRRTNIEDEVTATMNNGRDIFKSITSEEFDWHFEDFAQFYCDEDGLK